MAEGLHPYQGRQHRRLHRHLRPCRHRHDHRPLLRLRRLHPDSLHYRPGTARPPAQREDFQAVDISSIAAPVAKWATTVLEPAQVPYVFQKAFQLMRSDRPGRY